MPRQPKLCTVSTREVKAIWADIPANRTLTGKALKANRYTFPIPPTLKYADTGPLAPDGPVLACLYQSKKSPWAGVARLPLGDDLRIQDRGAIVYTPNTDEMMLRASVRFKGTGNILSVVGGLPFALLRREMAPLAVWAFMVLTEAAAAEIPREYRLIEVLTPRNAVQREAAALAETLRRRGQAALLRVFTIGAHPDHN